MTVGRSPRVIAASSEQARRHALQCARFTDPQLRYLSATEPNVIWRAGNQLGKSFALAADIVWTARGDHPFRQVAQAPTRIMVVSYSDDQMKPLMWKIWQFLDPTHIDPKLSCTEGGGLRGYKAPHIRFVGGPGKGSIITFATYKQGTQRIAGWTGDAVFCDEPMSQTVYGELAPRLLRRRGTMRITMTPTPDAPPQLWLKEMIDEEQRRAKEDGRRPRWLDLQTSISEGMLIPRGGLLERPLMTQTEIDTALSGYLSDELPQRRDGAWEGVLSGRWLTNYGEHSVTTSTPGHEKVFWAVGIDHGAKAGRQAAVLVAYGDSSKRAWAMDEYRSDGRTSTRDDAQAILAMLQRHGVAWHEVDYWIGDRAHGGDLYGNHKSNQELMIEFAELLGIGQQDLKRRGLRLRTPRKSSGSMRRGFRLINSLLRDGQLLIHERCESIHAAAQTWAGKLQDPHKDILDALRYPVERMYDDRVLSPTDRPTTAPVE